jgi:hypothetical protein
VSVPLPPEDLPTAILADVRPPIRWHRVAQLALWGIVALPALYQIGLLIEAIAGRVGYPYDLEWMEGGLLHHALRIRQGQGIYLPPSVDFIPYLYTPLYPTLLALFGGPFGISYLLGRTISILGLIGIAATALVSIGGARPRHLGAGFASVALSLGLFAAFYPYVEGWYDLVRADTLFALMITAGVAGLPRWSTSDAGLVGHGKVAAGAALMALAFFCKQTGIFYVALGGVIVVFANWRRALTYIAMAGLIGLGGTWLLNRSTHGWFWIYISEIHRAHDFNWDRFYASFGNILWHFPAPTIVIAATLLLAAYTTVRTRSVPPAARPFALWTAAFALSTVVGAIGFGTEYAHFNAYIPALLHGSLAAGAAVPAVIGCVRALAPDHRRTEPIAALCALAAAIPLAITCVRARWKPERFMPTAADETAGDLLIRRLKLIGGEIWMPSHPWYPVMAGLTPHVHRMGIKDVTTRQSRAIDGLDDHLRNHAFSAIVVDDRDVQGELPAVARNYHTAFVLPKLERPRVFTGAVAVPDSIWLPSSVAVPPPEAKVLFDFETGGWPDGWTRAGTAWGTGPVAAALPGQDLVLGATGLRFATSMNGGDDELGRVTSPMFTLDGVRLTMQLGGGTDASKLRVELWVDDAIANIASVPSPGGDSLRSVAIEIGNLRGKRARLVLVDDTKAAHLNVDDIWLWQ